jgi:hypothetical protein
VRTPLPRAACLLPGALLLVAAFAPSRADRIHLEGGGHVDTDSWRVEGELIVYSSDGGTVGLPRSIVTRIERTDPRDGSVTRTIDPRTGSDTADPAPAEAGPPTRFLPREVVRRLEEAGAALRSGDYRTAADLYESVMRETDSDFHDPRVGYAVSQIALGEDAIALAVVLDGLAHSPDHPALLELLGDLRNREERVPDALRAWRLAYERSPRERLEKKIAKAERELNAGRDYALTATSHFNVRYDGEVDEQLAEAVMEHLEDEYWKMADRFAHAPRQPITVLLYPTREFRDVTQAPEWVGGLYDGKIRVPLGGLRRLDPRASAVLSHELTHAFVHSVARGHCPQWLHEGLAQLAEGRTLSRKDRQGIVTRLTEHAPAEWEEHGFSYPIALSLTGWLESRGGFHRLVDLLELLGKGEDLDAALGAVYLRSYAELCRDWAEELLEEESR